MIDSFEPTEYFEGQSYCLICGADEAGRGPLCGPVVAAACILPEGVVIGEFAFSKTPYASMNP